MGKMVRFAVYTNEEKTAQRVSAFLRAWAEEICVELQLAMESGSPAALDADGCALLLVDSRRACPAGYCLPAGGARGVSGLRLGVAG